MTRVLLVLASVASVASVALVAGCRPTLTREDLIVWEEVPDEEPLPSLRTSRSSRTGEIIKRWAVLVYPNGRVEKHGNEKVYYDDGALKWERAYEHGKPAGTWKSYFEDGAVRSEYRYAGGGVETTMSFYHPGGGLSAQGEAREGIREGAWEFWHENGVTRQGGDYQAGERVGVWTTWHPNGGLESRGYYRDDARKGEWKHWGAEPAVMESAWRPELPAPGWGEGPQKVREGGGGEQTPALEREHS